MNKKSQILTKGVQIQKNKNFEEDNGNTIILLTVIALAVILTSLYFSIKF